MSNAIAIVSDLSFPVSELDAGPIMPPMETDHPSWKVVKPWDDALCPLAGYGLPSAKTAVQRGDQPAIHFADSITASNGERTLMAGEASWQDMTVTCKVEPVQQTTHPTMDCGFAHLARIGVVARAETSRKFYWFGIEGVRQLTLYCREDDDWRVLALESIELSQDVLTLSLTVQGDQITAHCAECDVTFEANDDTITQGKAGFRSLGESYLFELSTVCTKQEAVTPVSQIRSDLPKAKKVHEVKFSSEQKLLRIAPIVNEEKADLLVWEPERVIAMDVSGEVLWSYPHACNQAAAYVDGGRVYLIAGKLPMGEDSRSVRGVSIKKVETESLVVLDAKTGSELINISPPEDPDLNPEIVRWEKLSNSKDDYSYEQATSTGPGSIDFIFKKDHPSGRNPLWAFDAEGNQLWRRQCRVPYGHHNSIHLADIDGDGKREVLAGSACFSEAGEYLWEHESASEMLLIHGAVHYDATVHQNPAAGNGEQPICFMVGGSAGVYVVDATNGKDLHKHRIGHAQWGLPAKLRDDIPGRQFIFGTRWGNMGIVTMLNAQGERDWTIQADYIGQGAHGVQWEADGPQHLWINTSLKPFGLYDGHGKLIDPLISMRWTWGERPATQVLASSCKLDPSQTQDNLALLIDNTLHVFAAE